MYRVCVSCDDPLNQVSRIIDILRRMGAGLTAMDLMQVGGEEFEVTIDYTFAAAAQAETFLARLHLVPGVDVLDSQGLVQLVVPARCASGSD